MRVKALEEEVDQMAKELAQKDMQIQKMTSQSEDDAENLLLLEQVMRVGLVMFRGDVLWRLRTEGRGGFMYSRKTYILTRTNTSEVRQRPRMQGY